MPVCRRRPSMAAPCSARSGGDVRPVYAAARRGDDEVERCKYRTRAPEAARLRHGAQLAT